MKIAQKDYFHYTKAHWRLWAKAWRNSFKSGTFHCERSKETVDVSIRSYLQRFLQSVQKNDQPLTLAIYLPTETEVDLSPLFLAWLEAGHTLVASRVVGKGQLAWHLIHHLPQDDASLWQKNRYDIWEPHASCDLFEGVPDLVLVPCLMMDVKGFRLGYGGGFYDAQLKQWQAEADRIKQSMPLSLGILYEETVIRSLPIDEWDLPLDLFVTEEGLHQSINECESLKTFIYSQVK